MGDERERGGEAEGWRERVGRRKGSSVDGHAGHTPTQPGAFPPAARARILDLLFDPVKGLGFEIARYNVGGSGPGSPDTTNGNFRAGADVPCYQRPDGTFDWDADAAQRAILLGARDRGASNFEAFANSPPYWMTVSGRASGAAWGCAGNLARPSIPAFVDYLVGVVDHFRTTYGLTFKTIAPFNEPREVCWWVGTNQEGCRFRLPDQRRVMATLADALRGTGLADAGVRLAASDENRVDRAVSSLEAALGRSIVVRYGPDGAPYAKLKGLADDDVSLIAHVSTHAYNGLGSRAALRAVADFASVPVWMSEVGYGSAPPSKVHGALELATNVAADINVMGAAAWVYWQAVEDLDGGAWRGLAKLTPISSLGFRTLFMLSQLVSAARQRIASIRVRAREGAAAAEEYARPWWGLLLVSFSGSAGPPDHIVVSKQYHGLAHYSKFVRVGDRILRVPSERAKDTVAVLSADGARATLVATNDASTPRRMTFDVHPFLLANSKTKPSKKGGATPRALRAEIDSARSADAADDTPVPAATARWWVTDAERDVMEVDPVSLEAGGSGLLEVDLPPRSVSTLVLSVGKKK